MATLHTVRFEDVPRSAWRNGGGWTRELCAWPQSDDWIVRVSVADIESDGPFSAFPGVERWLAVLEGSGVELTHEGAAPIRLTATDALHRFRGDEPTQCRRIGESTRDFNLMLRRDAGAATVTSVPAGHAASSDWSGCFAAAPVRVRVAGESAWQLLPACSLAWVEAPARLDIAAEHEARAWRIDVVLSRAVRR